MNGLRLIALAIFFTALSGCLFTSEPATPKAEQTQRLDALALAPLQVQQTQVAAATAAELKAGYARLLAQREDSALHKRLADIDMQLAEQHQSQGDNPDLERAAYSAATERYQRLLSDYPEQVDAQVLYQLSRAQELQGQADASLATTEQLLARFPESIYAAEAHFRRGEYFYNRNQYAEAAASYQRNIGIADNDFFAIAAYMLGWSQYHQERYGEALSAYAKVLDFYIGEQHLGEQAPVTLGAGEQRLVDDSLRIMALTFSYADGANSLLAFTEQLGPKPYTPQLFNALAQLHLNNDRYEDSAAVYLAFTQAEPLHPQAPTFYIKHIDAYLLGDFPSQVLPAKAGFVESFGVHSDFWAQATMAQQDELKVTLKDYLKTLAQYHHSLAQQLKAQQLKAQQLNGEPASNPDTTKQHYAQAAKHYREYLLTFADQPDSAPMRFYLAESLFEAEQWLESIAEYQLYAYTDNGSSDAEQAADAGYAVILAYAEWQKAHPNEDISAAIASQWQFIQVFAQDPRALDVADGLLDWHFGADDFEQTLAITAWLLERELPQALQQRAQLAQAHSHFALNDYENAEFAYQDLLAALPKEDGRRAELQERLAISLYRQGEALVAEQPLQAVALWQRISSELPSSKVRVNAQFDAANLLLQQQQWPEAIALLTDFASRFAAHELSQGIDDKLIYAFEQSARWVDAADLYFAQWQHSPNSEDGRLALLTAAEYFHKAELRDKALPAFRTYAHQYPQPFAEAMEARQTMSAFYVASGEDSKRRFWLNKIIQADAQAGAARTERSRYLAAQASLVFAEDKRVAFAQIPLALPLKQSLTKKRQAMQQALQAYDSVLAYGVAEFSSAANFQVAELYLQLSAALLASERPPGLDALALSQYDILLEEQAIPFEDEGIALHQANTERTQQGLYNPWIARSFSALAALMPVRYAKTEQHQELTYEHL